jgi:hypothetical protein
MSKFSSPPLRSEVENKIAINDFVSFEQWEYTPAGWFSGPQKNKVVRTGRGIVKSINYDTKDNTKVRSITLEYVKIDGKEGRENQVIIEFPPFEITNVEKSSLKDQPTAPISSSIETIIPFSGQNSRIGGKRRHSKKSKKSKKSRKSRKSSRRK